MGIRYSVVLHPDGQLSQQSKRITEFTEKRREHREILVRKNPSVASLLLCELCDSLLTPLEEVGWNVGTEWLAKAYCGALEARLIIGSCGIRTSFAVLKPCAVA